MWIKKSANEVNSDRSAARRQNYLAWLGLPLLVCAIVSSRVGLGLPTAVRVSATVVAGFILLAWFQRRRWSRARSTVQICDQCNVVRTADGKTDCPCGGKLYSLDSMKWVDSPAHQTGRPPTDHPVSVVFPLL